jgi:nanoRNase/pAp phosphatase (c-di-AMP/oligoRNAs hydrolase)
MRYVLVCTDDFLWKLVPPSAGFNGIYVVSTVATRARIARHGDEAVAGDLGDAALYRRAFRTGHEPVIVAVPPLRRPRILAAIRAVAPTAPLVLLGDESDAEVDAGDEIVLPRDSVLERVVVPEVERAIARARLARIRRVLDPAARVLILMQDDPDPDAIASALALRVVLGRRPAAAPIATFGRITRPENRAMTRILDIDVEPLDPAAVAGFDAVAMVDVQPSFFEERLGDVALVIDHHPEEKPVHARVKDIRSSYGATSTILTEYLRAADAKITPRLATALLYGIKADTLYLERGTTRADVEAFGFLHPLANHNALRRIERPDIPEAALDILALGIRHRRLVDGVMFVHLGPVGYPELVAQFADLFLQIEGAEWSVVSGIVNDELHVSVRNVGYVRSAGEVVRAAFGELGGAGGHRAMAKAVIPLATWRARVGAAEPEPIAASIAARFRDALGSGRAPLGS